MVNVLYRSLLQIFNQQFGGGLRKRFLKLILLGVASTGFRLYLEI